MNGHPLISSSAGLPSTQPPPPPPLSTLVGQPVPRDAEAIQQLLASLGLQPGDYQPKVIAQLLEWQTRYTREILEDAQEYCLHRERPGQKSCIDVDDLELAIQTRDSDSFTSPPPKELLFQLASTRNTPPLPIVPTREGVHLPPDKFCLMAPNYRVKTTTTTGQTNTTTGGAGIRREEYKSHI